MNEGWEIIRLGDYAEKIGSGATPRGGSSVYVDKGEISLIRSQNIYNNGFSHGGLVYITKEAGENLRNVVVEEQDVLLNITGDSVARVCMPAPSILPARVNQHVAIIRTLKNEIDPLYLKYFLSSPRQQQVLLNLASAGATRNALTKGMIEDIILPKPPLKKQIRIREHLSVLDKKIHLLRQQNATLESMAQALFKSWFVDFDPVIDNALEAGRVLPEALGVRVALRGAVLAGGAYSGLPEEVKGLFPDSFVFSDELGKWVPEGWEAGTLKDVARNPKISVRPENMTDGTPYIGLQDMPQKSIALSRWSVSDEVGSNKYQFEKGDILFGKLRPYFHKVGIAPVDGVCSTDILVIEPTNEAYSSLVLGHVTSVKLIDHVTACSTGTRMPRTNWSDIGRYEIAIPPIEIASYLTTKIQANWFAPLLIGLSYSSVRKLNVGRCPVCLFG
jgi:type I restriction enzyme S subunit